MTERFLKAMPFVFEHEGGYNDVKNDKGGATNWGVSLRFLRSINKDIDGDGDVDFMDIKKLTKENAMEIYYNNFWKNLYEKLPEKLAIKLFDTGINAGTTRSNILLQRALRSLGSNIKEDGAIGQLTMNELVKYNEKQLLISYCKVQKDFYDSIIQKDPTQEKFRKGWHNRAKFIPFE